MLKKIFIIFLVIFILSNSFIFAASENKESIKIEQNQKASSITLEGNFLTYIKTNNFIELCSLLKECEFRKINALKMEDAAKNCGYLDTHPVIQLAKKEWYMADQLAQKYIYDIEKIQYAQAWKEYPVATEVWLYLTNAMEYNNYVAAGIMGNIMAECGGLTLNLNWSAINKYSGCYGLCQWHPRYHPDIQNGNLQNQLNYMSTSFPSQISKYAYTYKKDFTYEQFLKLEDVKEIAKAFCIIYERPGKYDIRRGECAVKAYDYFVNDIKEQK